MLRFVISSEKPVARRAVYQRFVTAFVVGMMIACSAHVLPR
jgi:hypothetical protein